MSKAKRTERLVALTKYLLDRPSRLFPFSHFTGQFLVSKATLSEDIQILRESFAQFCFGEIKTLSGAGGGVCFLPKHGKEETGAFLANLAARLAAPERIISGGYLYTSDLLFDPPTAMFLGEIIYQRMVINYRPDYIMTVETKGIPLALMTARAFGVPLVVARRDSRVTEGSSVSINYLSGSTRFIQSMSLPKRALPPNSSVIIIDDFMKAGGTARGMINLAHEVGARVLSLCVLMVTQEPKVKMVNNYTALFSIKQLDELRKFTEIELFKEM
jgi:purine operon repressor